MVELGAVFGDNSWTGTLFSESLFPRWDELVRQVFKGLYEPEVPGAVSPLFLLYPGQGVAWGWLE